MTTRFLGSPLSVAAARVPQFLESSARRRVHDGQLHDSGACAAQILESSAHPDRVPGDSTAIPAQDNQHASGAECRRAQPTMGKGGGGGYFRGCSAFRELAYGLVGGSAAKPRVFYEAYGLVGGSAARRGLGVLEKPPNCSTALLRTGEPPITTQLSQRPWHMRRGPLASEAKQQWSSVGVRLWAQLGNAKGEKSSGSRGPAARVFSPGSDNGAVRNSSKSHNCTT